MLVFVFASCKKNDFTGDSTQKPTNPTVTVDWGTIPTVIDGVNQSHNVTINMDEAQVVDVVVNINVLDGGTATEGEDFEVPNSVTIKAGRTSATFTVSFIADEVYEETETFTIQVGDDQIANASITPVTQEFSIHNFAATDLAFEMSWMPEAYDQYGNQIDYTSVADMILYVYDPNDVLVGQVDGGAYEGYVLSGDSIDGTYKIMAGFYSAMQFDKAVEMNLALSYDQPGVFTDVQDFTGQLSTATAVLCDIKIYLGEIEKVGTTYTLTKTGYNLFTLNVPDFVGNYGGADGSLGDGANWQFANPVTTTLSGADLLIDGLNHDWMQTIWGETVTSTTPVVVTMSNDGTFVIDDQPYMITDAGGTPYNYNISGSGTWSSCTPVSFHIQYDMYNTTDGYSVGAWLLANGYSYTNYFIADITKGSKGVVTNHTTTKIKR